LQLDFGSLSLKDNSFQTANCSAEQFASLMEYADQASFPFVMNWEQVAFYYEVKRATKQSLP